MDHSKLSDEELIELTKDAFSLMSYYNAASGISFSKENSERVDQSNWLTSLTNELVKRNLTIPVGNWLA